MVVAGQENEGMAWSGQPTLPTKVLRGIGFK